MRTFLFAAVLTFGTSAVVAVDMLGPWSFEKPDVSEQCFRGAPKSATGDDAPILKTQIARTLPLTPSGILIR